MISHFDRRFPLSASVALLFIAGCAPERSAPPLAQVDASPPNVVSGRTDRTPRAIAPGTSLGENGFRSALRATGSRWIVVPVFAAECGPCMTEALELTARRPAWKATDVDVIGMGMDETAADVRRFFHATGDRVDYPLYHAAWFAKQHDVEVTPTVFIYSADGDLLFRTDAIEAEFGIQAALDEKLAELAGAK